MLHIGLQTEKIVDKKTWHWCAQLYFPLLIKMQNYHLNYPWAVTSWGWLYITCNQGELLYGVF